VSPDKIDNRSRKALKIALIIAIVFGGYFLKSYFVVIALAAIVAYLFNPVYKRVLKLTNQHANTAAGLTFVIFVFTVSIPLAIILFITFEQALQLSDLIREASNANSGIYSTLTHLIAGANSQLDKLPSVGPETIKLSQIADWLKSNSSTILKTTVSYLSGVAGGVSDLLTRTIIFIFIFLSILKKQDRLLATIKKLNPLGNTSTDYYLNRMGAMTSAMVKGQFLIAAAQGLTDALLLQIAGMHYFIFWFIFITFLSIIPLGGGVIVIPVGIILILTGHIWQGLLLIIGHVIIVTNIDNVLRPALVPKSAKLDSALLILSVFAGIGMFGILGIVMGPVLMIVIVTTIELYLTSQTSQHPTHSTKP
jgi:predicted PurR-regulated permease PerM